MHRQTPLDRLDQEIQDHLEIETRDNLDRGMNPVKARRAARLAFGNVALAKQEAYNVWHPVWLQQLLQDTKYALRSLLRNRRFAGTVIFTLALAIGMNIAVFSVVEAVLIRPLPYPEASRLAWLAPSTGIIKQRMTTISNVRITQPGVPKPELSIELPLTAIKT